MKLNYQKAHFTVNPNKFFSFSCFELLIASAWSYHGFIYYFETVIRVLFGVVFAKAFTAIYFLVLIMLSWKQINKRVRTSDIGFVLVVLAIILISYLFNFESREYIIDLLPTTLFGVIPYYFVGLLIDNDDRTMNLLYTFSVGAVLANFLYVLVILGTGREMQSDNLAIAYMVLPHALMIMWFAMKKMTEKRFMLTVLAFVLLLFLGSRGPVIACIVFFVLYNIRKCGDNAWKAFVRVILPACILLVILFSGLYKDILILIRALAEKVNLSTRVFDAILEDAAAGSNAERWEIYKTIWTNIKKNPVLGYGVYGEWPMVFYYAHSIVLELLSHYGLIFGSIILISSLWKIITTYLYSVNQNTKDFIMIMGCFGLLRGIYAGSYMSYYIFLLMGFVIGRSRIECNKRGMIKI